MVLTICCARATTPPPVGPRAPASRAPSAAVSLQLSHSTSRRIPTSATQSPRAAASTAAADLPPRLRLPPTPRRLPRSARPTCRLLPPADSAAHTRTPTAPPIYVACTEQLSVPLPPLPPPPLLTPTSMLGAVVCRCVQRSVLLPHLLCHLELPPLSLSLSLSASLARLGTRPPPLLLQFSPSDPEMHTHRHSPSIKEFILLFPSYSLRFRPRDAYPQA